MLNTKTKPGTYSNDDYWIVTYRNIFSDDTSVKTLEYTDVDFAYEDYQYYCNKYGSKNVTYKHCKR